MNSYRELIVWQKSVSFAVEIYTITKLFPKEEMFSLVSQLRRAAASISANIAEGYCRGHRKEYIQFLLIAFGSGAEIETFLLIAHRVGYIQKEKYDVLIENLSEIMKMLNVLISKLDPKP